MIYDGYGNLNSSEILLIIDSSSTGGGQTDDDDDDTTEDLGSIPGAELLYILVVSMATFMYIVMKSKKKKKFI